MVHIRNKDKSIAFVINVDQPRSHWSRKYFTDGYRMTVFDDKLPVFQVEVLYVASRSAIYKEF